MLEIPKKELTTIIESVNNKFFFISDVKAYVDKVTKFGECLLRRDEKGDLIGLLLFYNNKPFVYATMLWTREDQRGKGIGTQLFIELIQKNNKDIFLEANVSNPSKRLLERLNFKDFQQNGEQMTMLYAKRLSIMQPYIFPYLGYFHLIESSNEIIFYDDVNFIKGGWINRNRILVNGNDSLFTIPLSKSGSHKLIGETKLHPTLFPIWRRKFLKTIEQSYSKAPFYSNSFNLIKNALDCECESIADLAIHTITSIYKYLDKDIKWTKSSITSPETKGMDKADRIIQISKNLGYQNYINPIGGQELYDKDYFNSKGVKLNFVKSQKIEYKQFDNEFVPWLSIIDVLMFNDKNAVKEQINSYNIV